MDTGATPSIAPRVLGFGVFVLDLDTGELRKSGLRVRLAPRPYKLLALLTSRPGRLVSRQEIQAELWGGATFVDFEQGVNHCVKQIRDALRDDAESPRFVETVPRRGYRFIARVSPAVAVEPPTPEPAPAAAPPVDPAAAPPRPERRRRLLVGAGLLLLASTTVADYLAGPHPPGEVGAPRQTRIAVLPFANLSGDPTHEHLADSLTEEVISELGRRHPARLGVIARTSAMTYKGARKSVAEVGRELRVDYVLEGSVRRLRDRMRVHARLVGARDQAQLWAGEFEGDLRDVVHLPSEVALTLAQRLPLFESVGPPAPRSSPSGADDWRLARPRSRSARPDPPGTVDGGAGEGPRTSPDDLDDLEAPPPVSMAGPPP